MTYEKGCFVYRAKSSIAVRSGPSTDDKYRTQLSVKPGNFVCISELFTVKTPVKDQKCIIQQRYLRLNDGSGWIFEREKDNSEIFLMERVDTESGLWIFYVDNFFTGIRLRNHPIDEKNQSNTTKVLLNNTYEPKELLPPMQKVYCDLKVVDGSVSFYRVQATRNAWIFDKRINPDTNKTTNFMLIPEDTVRTGLFAFVNVSQKRLGLRLRPDVGDDNRFHDHTIKKNEIVVCDFIRQSPRPRSTNGPFLHLKNGMGWLFEYKYGEPMMEETLIEEGLWSFRIMNSAGIQLRKQPIDNTKFRFDKIYARGETVVCDRRIAGIGDVCFYRVQGTNGWVFDKRGPSNMMAPIINSHSSSIENIRDVGWTSDFVRGVAFAVGGLQEVTFNPQSRVISFVKDGSTTRINVYYTTKTIGTAMNHPKKGKTQLFRRNCTNTELSEIMKNPRIHTDRGYCRREGARPVTINNEAGVEGDAEEAMRYALIECEESIHELERRRRQLTESVLDKERKRLKTSKKRIHTFQTTVLSDIEEREKKMRTCDICGNEFGSPEAVDNHKKAVHGDFTCNNCWKSFGNLHALNQHKNATSHF